MKVTRDMIDPQLRFMGKMMDRITGSRMSTVENVRKQAESPSLLLGLLMKMVPKPKGIQIDEQWIPRDDGSEMRIVVMKPLQPKKWRLGSPQPAWWRLLHGRRRHGILLPAVHRGK